MINFLLNACINGKKREILHQKRYHLKISTGSTNYTIHKKLGLFIQKQKLKESVILSQLFLGLFFCY